MRAVQETAEHISLTERLAFNAENSAKSRIIAKWLTSKIGETFNCYVSSVTPAGLFVNIIENGASGLIPIRNISNRYVIYDAKTNTLKDKTKKKIYKLGHKINAKLVETDEIRGLLTFALS